MSYLPFENEHESEGEYDSLTKGSLSIIKKASRRELLVEEKQLVNSLLHALFREVRKAKKLEKGLQLYRDDELFKELSKRYMGYDVFHPERSFYDAFATEVEHEAVKELRGELAAAISEYNELKEAIRQNRRMTEPYL